MLGSTELLLIFFVALLLFGGKRLPELAKSLGVALREFKKSTQGLDDEVIEVKSSKKPSEAEN